MAEGWDRNSANRRADYVSKQCGSRSYSHSWKTHEDWQAVVCAFGTLAEAIRLTSVSAETLAGTFRGFADISDLSRLD